MILDDILDKVTKDYLNTKLESFKSSNLMRANCSSVLLSILKSVLDEFNIKNLDDYIPIYIKLEDNIDDFIINIIKNIINENIPNTGIWSNLYDLRIYFTDEDHYGKSWKMISFKVLHKDSALNKLSPKYVYENIEEINKFMSLDNELYDKLKSLEIDTYY